MTGGELVVHGSRGREAGALMRRGLLVASAATRGASRRAPA